MKIIRITVLLCVLIMVLLSNQVSAQIRALTCKDQLPGQWLIRLHYQNDSGEKGVSVFQWDYDGHLTKGLWYLLDGTRSSVNFYTLDEKDRITDVFRIFSDQLTSEFHYNYNEKNLIIHESYYRSDGVEGEISYIYDNQDRLIRADADKGQGWFTGSTTYIYDEKNRKSGGELIHQNQVIGKLEFLYDEHNRLIEEKWVWDAGWAQTFSYEYDDYSNVSSYTPTTSKPYFDIQDGLKVRQESYNYSDRFKGHSILEYEKDRRIRQVYAGEEDNTITVTHFFYDGKNQMVNAYRRYTDGRSAVFTHTHNSDGKLVKRVGQFPNGNKIEEEYEYGEKGRLFKTHWRNFDSWLNGNITYFYEKGNQISKAEFKDNKGSIIEIDYGYNEKGCLGDVYWDFGDEGFQRYSFSYMPEDEDLIQGKALTPIWNQPWPGEEPVLFAPGIVSDGLNNRDITMSPDGNEIYWCTMNKGYEFSTILYSKKVDDFWTPPRVVSFASNPRYMFIEPHITADGRHMYFMTNMPESGSGEPSDEDIWCVDRTDTGWGEPYNIGSPVNTEGGEFFPSLTRNNTLYFTREEADTRENFIYRSKMHNGKFTEPEKLPEQVNCGSDRFNAYISSSEDFIILTSHIREDTYGGYDYYIVFRNDKDQWSEPLNMGECINMPAGEEWSPYISPDGKYFFFMSSRRLSEKERPEMLTYKFFQDLHRSPGNGNFDIYWLKSDFIDKLRPEGWR